MNRKLQHTFMALAASAALFAVLLLAGDPALRNAPSAPAHRVTISADLGDVDASDDVGIDASVLEADPAGAVAHRRSRRTRALLALPYFSFAQGLRHNRS